jgi:hypothetical protein
LEGSVHWDVPSVATDDGGAFDLDIPSAPVPQNGIQLTITGDKADRVVLDIPRTDLLGSGDLGALALPRVPDPLPQSVVATLAGFVPTKPGDIDDRPDAWAGLQPDIMLGEGDCATAFRNDGRAFDTFSYGMLFRLVDPELWPKMLRTEIELFGKNVSIPIPVLEDLPPWMKPLVDWLMANGEITFKDRVPIDKPIGVDHFLKTLSDDPIAAPKAGTLGIGYVLGLRQTWEPTGFSLGDLLYSLPLAPGERQRLAIRERRETLATYDRESLSVAEQRAFDESVNSTANTVFESSLDEEGAGGTSWSERSESGSSGGGVSFLGISFGGGSASSSASGNASSWANASRDFLASAVESFHGAVARNSATARQVARTSVRLASSTDREEITTKVIGNYNRMHALTVQYWEVLRHFSVTSRADDVTLVALVPLQLIQWLPDGVPKTLSFTANPPLDTLLHRYEVIWRYADEIRTRLPRRIYHEGVRELARLMTTRNMTVNVVSSSSSVTLNLSITATFLPFDTVTVNAIGRNGRSLGRAVLSPTSTPPDFGRHFNEEGLIGAFRTFRRGTLFGIPVFNSTRTGSLSLRPGVSASDIERFDVRTRISAYSHTPDPDQVKISIFGLGASLDIEDMGKWEEAAGKNILPGLIQPFSISAGRLRREVGGPKLESFSVRVGTTPLVNDDPIEERVLPAWMPVPALSTPPSLTAAQLMRIEELLQHVMAEPVRYSQAVWTSMDAQERSVLLEAYTIGLPPESAGLSDNSQEIPLLNCTTNRLLGFFGNSMVIPFHLPPELERAMSRRRDGDTENTKVSVTTRDIQEALLQFHREGYQPRKTSVTLPTRGLLAEAVLGECKSAEKIDLTRFWNWQDGAPEDVRAISLPKQPLTELARTGAAAPSVAAGLLAPQITNGFVPQAPQKPSKALEDSLTAAVPWLKKGLGDMRGLDTLDALMKVALGEGGKPGVDREAVEALLGKITTQAGETGMKIGKLAEFLRYDKEQDKERLTDQKARETAAKKEAEAEANTAAEKKAAGIKAMIENANAFAAFVAAQPEASRAEVAAKLVKENVGKPEDLNAVEQANLFAAYVDKSDESEEVKTGKAVIRTALSLP